MIFMNPIAVKNNIIVTLHLDDEECDSKRLALYGELHGDEAIGIHWVALMPLGVRLVFTSLSSSLSSFLKTEYGIKLTVAPPSISILEIGFPSM
jgi:hypothetical protein